MSRGCAAEETSPSGRNGFLENQSVFWKNGMVFFRKLRDKPFFMKQEGSPPTDYIAK
jgi:hypothetical protein